MLAKCTVKCHFVLVSKMASCAVYFFIKGGSQFTDVHDST